MSIDVDAIRQRHTSTLMKHCHWCFAVWPCETLRAADEIEALREQVAALLGDLRRVRQRVGVRNE